MPPDHSCQVGLQRVIATLAGAVIAGLIALWLARADRADAPTGYRVPPAGVPGDPTGGTSPEASEST
jgi:hypothetical protein